MQIPHSRPLQATKRNKMNHFLLTGSVFAYLCEKRNITMARDITHAERAAIYYHLSGKCSDWTQLYIIAKGNGALDRLSTDESRAATVSRWKKSESIQNAIKETAYILQREREEADKRAVEAYKMNQENPDGETPLTEVNFLDRDEFLAYLNKQANRIQDEKTRNETLKMISDNLRFKDMEKENEEHEEQVRAYLPLQCHDCVLYQRCKGCPLEKCLNAE